MSESEFDVGSTEPKWMIDENTPGVGDRPSWLPEKYKSTADLAKGYQELSSQRGYVPEEYDFSQSVMIDDEFEGFQKLKQVAKDKRVPKEVMDVFIESVDGYFGQYAIDPKSELEKLGKDGKAMVDQLSNFISNSVDKDTAEAIFSNVKTAEGINALNELRKSIMSNNTSIPSGNSQSSTGTSTIEDVRSEITNNLEKFKTDSTYRKQMQDKIERVASQSDYVDKRGG